MLPYTFQCLAIRKSYRGLKLALLAGGLAVVMCVGAVNGAGLSVDDKYIMANTANSKEWPTYGLDYAETRFSKLARINTDNVKDLGLVWSYDLESARGVEATPIVVGGVMFVTAPWSIVTALDARTGRKLWVFDPKVARAEGYKLCCDVVNRGVAIYKGKVFVGTTDGRLIALDFATGKKAWEKNTALDPARSYSITAAPRIYGGKVIIGNGGDEYGVRGYVTAYDAKTGRQEWRWFTVPGDPSKPYEDEAQARAAKTWDPSVKYWETGGGGAVWNAVAFDPKLNLIYIGTGNAAPWSAHKRSPAGGDNLYVASIVALDAATGKYVWHYQETPADNWDFDAVQDLILADLMIDGEPRQTIVQASKNGFFFVIDRATGKFISAKNFAPVNWASGYDANGRPVELPGRREAAKPYEIAPGPYGAHNWQPMSWNPVLRLAYIPAQIIPLTLADDGYWKGYGTNVPGETMSGIGWNLAEYVDSTSPITNRVYGRLVAWDPAAQREVWGVDHVGPWNGGTLTTAGNLVFQGTSDARFIAYNARTGKQLWESPTGTGVIAAPMTYEIDGRQYVSVAVGWGGVFGQSKRVTDRKMPGTVYTFSPGGTAKLPQFVDDQLGALVSGVTYRPEDVEAGKQLYLSNCVFCHGVPGVDKGGNIPNLGYVPAPIISNLGQIVLTGVLTERGMPNFSGKLSEGDVVKIEAFIQGTADAIRPKAAAASVGSAGEHSGGRDFK